MKQAVNELRELLTRGDLRSADRANLRTMLKKVEVGRGLTYQERQNLNAYQTRYHPPAATN